MTSVWTHTLECLVLCAVSCAVAAKSQPRYTGSLYVLGNSTSLFVNSMKSTFANGGLAKPFGSLLSIAEKDGVKYRSSAESEAKYRRVKRLTRKRLSLQS